MPFTFDFIKVKSYKGLNSVGSVQITGGDLAALEGKNVLVVEDIIDTGKSLYEAGAVGPAAGGKGGFVARHGRSLSAVGPRPL